ncbi:MAG: circularly permuted type 2 ATP-grasp protein [Planctomycetales bacterium]|nr:circularly permuted type 2 ATP-grasp protein [Planctomycetales bacterium]
MMQGQQQSTGGPWTAGNGAAPAPTGSPLAAAYCPVAGAYDEAYAADGGLRPRWQQLSGLLGRFAPGEFSRRWQESQRLIRENGLAYSAFGDPQHQPRPWQLDPLPMVAPADEWQAVSAGLIQRAQLLRMVLDDLFGPQTLIRRGVLPAAALFSHPGFRRPFHRIANEGDPGFLQNYAADLSRAADGTWWVLDDRTESPSGAGFVLENRVVVSRMLPEAFRAMYVSRLAPFFISWQEQLRELARTHRDNPRIVVLSQGPHQPDFFEDAYLARYLGYTLVEGADLAVRNSRVWLKTLEGLSPVDVIVRRPNSDLCDPLELGGASPLGVPGLMQAVRCGNVVVANPLGSGLIESPLFMAFMPRLAAALLGEKLKLPGVATWWCGEEASLKHVLANLPRLRIKSAFRRRGRDTAQSHELEGLAPEQLAERIKANPAAFVGQEVVHRSTAPEWNEAGGVRPVHLVVRAFAAASGDSYTVLEGGLARTDQSTAPNADSDEPAEKSKDLWIVGHDEVEHVTLLAKRDEPIALRRAGSELPSRVADSAFWLGRQIERAEASARLLRTVALRMSSESAGQASPAMPALWRVLAEQGQIEPGFVVEGIRQRLPKLEQSLPPMVFDATQPGSLAGVVAQTFRIASQVRDRISVDSWRVIKRIQSQFERADAASADWTRVLNLSNELIIDFAAIGGMVSESMTRTQLFRFLDIGRRLERALQLATLLRCSFGGKDPVSLELFEAVLEIADSLMTYRSRYLANLQLATVLDLLLTDETNPRSIAYQLSLLEGHIAELPRDARRPRMDADQRLITSMSHVVRLLDVEAVAEAQGLGDETVLRDLLERLEAELPQLSDAIAHRFLVHAGPAIQISSIHYDG